MIHAVTKPKVKQHKSRIMNITFNTFRVTIFSYFWASDIKNILSTAIAAMIREEYICGVPMKNHKTYHIIDVGFITLKYVIPYKGTLNNPTIMSETLRLIKAKSDLFLFCFLFLWALVVRWITKLLVEIITSEIITIKISNVKKANVWCREKSSG